MKKKDLQTLLDITQHWCFKWKLKINVKKSKIMHVMHNRKSSQPLTSDWDMPLQYCESYKYLQIDFI